MLLKCCIIHMFFSFLILDVTTSGVLSEEPSFEVIYGDGGNMVILLFLFMLLDHL
jgi:hypothetical protein